MSGIYRIIHKSSNKTLFIGSTKMSFAQRRRIFWHELAGGESACVGLQRLFSKYGPDQFDLVELEPYEGPGLIARRNELIRLHQPPLNRIHKVRRD